MSATLQATAIERHLAQKYGPDCYGLKVYREQIKKAASDIRNADSQAKADRTTLLRDARRLYEDLGYGNLQGLHLRLARGGIDAASLPGLDDVAERMVSLHPEHFAGVQDNEQRLFELLTSGNPKPMTKEEAADKAMECLTGEKTHHLEFLGQRWQAGEKITVLAQDVGYSWNRLWVELTNLGYAKGGRA
jgi:hypothetical protein